MAISIATLLFAPGARAISGGVAWQPRVGGDLIGTKAPQWRGIEWLQGGPLSLADLTRSGKVVLLRFWLIDCPLCEQTAPALRELHERYRQRGLVVVGIHHPKSERSRQSEIVLERTRELGFAFPVGTDDEWQTLRAYGVGTVFESYTSVSFVIDAGGVIRFVHDGGEFHRGGGNGHAECNSAYEALVASIEEVLADRARSLGQPEIEN